jgi:hypothetical protein
VSLENALRAVHLSRALDALRSESADNAALAVLVAHEGGINHAELARHLGVDRSRVSQLCARGRTLRAGTQPPANEESPHA